MVGGTVEAGFQGEGASERGEVASDTAEGADSDFGFGARTRIRERKQLRSKLRERALLRESGSPGESADSKAPSLKKE
jgi:hypothetical protein